MGEMTEVLSPSYDEFVRGNVASRSMFDPHCPPEDGDVDPDVWTELPMRWLKFHDFTYVGDFGDPDELAAIVARIYGPVAEKWARDNKKSSIAYRLRLYYGQVEK
jgi:hypothetical protein